MRFKYLLGFIVVAGTMLFISSASFAVENQAAAPHEGKKQAHAQNDPWAIGLTEEQRTQMKALRDEGRTKTELLRAEVKTKKVALKEEMNAVNPDRAKAVAIVKDIVALEEQLSLLYIDDVFKVRNILTAEQYQKMREMRGKKKSSRKDRRNDQEHGDSENKDLK